MTDTSNVANAPEPADDIPPPDAEADNAKPVGAAHGKLRDEAVSLKTQATDKARDLATQGKDRATGALSDASRFLEDTARTVDEKLGEQYGAYARTAAQSVSGFADTLKNKDVDDLIADARDLVRKSPGIAIGAAAAAGFLFARLLKSGIAYDGDDTPSGRA